MTQKNKQGMIYAGSNYQKSLLDQSKNSEKNIGDLYNEESKFE
jgi:hypothetical protein